MVIDAQKQLGKSQHRSHCSAHRDGQMTCVISLSLSVSLSLRPVNEMTAWH